MEGEENSSGHGEKNPWNKGKVSHETWVKVVYKAGVNDANDAPARASTC